MSVPADGWLQRLLARGWGDAWGIFIVSRAPLARLRTQLTHMMSVELDSHPGPLLFRFFDPRVARQFLPTATPRQAALWFDEVQSFLAESEDGSPLCFEQRGPTVTSRVIAVTGDGLA